MGWRVVQSGRYKHIVPQTDLLPHHHSTQCWCHPDRDSEDATVIVHRSMDCREASEGKSLH